MRRVSARVDLRSTEEGMGSRLRLHGGAGSSREKRVSRRGSVLGGEIPRLRFAALRMTCGGGSGRFANKPLPDGCQTGRRDGSPPPVFTGAGSRREDNGGEGERAVREQPLPDGCQTGGRDGSPPPVFTGAGSRREDNGRGGGADGSRTAPTRWLSDGWEGWVPAPRLHGGRISTRGQRGGERDGRFANKAPTRWLSDGWEGWVPAPRLHEGRISTRGQRGGGAGVRVGGWG